jgi:hypothetical protein
LGPRLHAGVARFPTFNRRSTVWATLNGNLHIFNGCSSVIYFCPDIGNNYANNLTFGDEHIIDAWNNAGSQTYSYQNKGVTNTVVFAYVADGNCLNDTLTSYQSPGAGLQYKQTTVYTYSP